MSTDGGAEEDRTPDPHNAIVVLYQLSYDPIRVRFVARYAIFTGDPTGTRTRATTVKGWCPNR